MHSQNRKCNALQCIMGIFLHSSSAPEKLVKLLSRMGLSISLASVHRAIKSLAAFAEADLLAMGETLLNSYAFDNLDARIKTAIPTVDKDGDGLLHITTSALFRLEHGVKLEHLRCADLLWSRSELNLFASDPRPFNARQTYLRLCSLHPDPARTTGSLSRRGQFRSWSLKRILFLYGPKYFNKGFQGLRALDPVEAIPVKKTHYVPVKAMDINPSTVSGNIDVLYNMYAQTGVGDSHEDPRVKDIAEYVTLVHGDLGSYEHVRSAMRRRLQENTPFLRLQSVVFVPGLFHLKMAAADAIWRALVAPTGARQDATSFMRIAAKLRPAESSRLVSNASFRQQHELINHVGILLSLDAWRIEVRRRFGLESLEEWAAHKPSQEEVDELAESLVRNNIEGEGIDMWKMQQRAADERDQVPENTMRTLNYIFLYEELAYAMNAGDIGRIETLLVPWIPLFRATGKHKYGNLMLRFWHSLYFVYPDELRLVCWCLQSPCGHVRLPKQPTTMCL